MSWSYSNTGFIVLGQIAGRAAGQPIADALREGIFTPVGVRATTFETGPRIAGPHAHGYDALSGKTVHDVSVIDQMRAWTAGAIVSNPDDLARSYRALLQGRLLRPDLLAPMETMSRSAAAHRVATRMARASPPCRCRPAWPGDTTAARRATCRAFSVAAAPSARSSS
jgi:CubicO group peptidase (beta-lactamase class C family)